MEKQKPSAVTSTNPAQKQGVNTPNPASIRGKAYEALLAGAFSSMHALNPSITANLANSLLDFFITRADEVSIPSNGSIQFL